MTKLRFHTNLTKVEVENLIVEINNKNQNEVSQWRITHLFTTVVPLGDDESLVFYTMALEQS